MRVPQRGKLVGRAPLLCFWPTDAVLSERAVEGGISRRYTARRLALSERSESKGGSNSVVESQPSKLLVAGSIPVSRSIPRASLTWD